MITGCLIDNVEVLSRQYENSFTTVEASSELVLSSVQHHTMLAEIIIGELCEKKISLHAYISTVSNIIDCGHNQQIA